MKIKELTLIITIISFVISIIMIFISLFIKNIDSNKAILLNIGISLFGASAVSSLITFFDYYETKKSIGQTILLNFIYVDNLFQKYIYLECLSSKDRLIEILSILENHLYKINYKLNELFNSFFLKGKLKEERKNYLILGIKIEDLLSKVFAISIMIKNDEFKYDYNEYIELLRNDLYSSNLINLINKILKKLKLQEIFITSDDYKVKKSIKEINNYFSQRKNNKH